MTIVMFVFAVLWLICQVYLMSVYLRITRKETAVMNDEIASYKMEENYIRDVASGLYEHHLKYKKTAESRNPEVKTIDDPVEKITPWLL